MDRTRVSLNINPEMNSSLGIIIVWLAKGLRHTPGQL